MAKPRNGARTKQLLSYCASSLAYRVERSRMDLTSIFTGVGAALLVSLVQGIVGPLMERRVERERQRMKRRKRLIQDWREMVRDIWRNGRILHAMKESDWGGAGDLDPRYEQLRQPLVGEMLKSDERYYSLRNRMSQSAREKIESNADVETVENLVMPQSLSDVSYEIDRIESEWDLVSGNESDSDIHPWWSWRQLKSSILGSEKEMQNDSEEQY